MQGTFNTLIMKGIINQSKSIKSNQPKQNQSQDMMRSLGTPEKQVQGYLAGGLRPRGWWFGL